MVTRAFCSTSSASVGSRRIRLATPKSVSLIWCTRSANASWSPERARSTTSLSKRPSARWSFDLRLPMMRVVIGENVQCVPRSPLARCPMRDDGAPRASDRSFGAWSSPRGCPERLLGRYSGSSVLSDEHITMPISVGISRSDHSAQPGAACQACAHLSRVSACGSPGRAVIDGDRTLRRFSIVGLGGGAG